ALLRREHERHVHGGGVSGRRKLPTPDATRDALRKPAVALGIAAIDDRVRHAAAGLHGDRDIDARGGRRVSVARVQRWLPARALHAPRVARDRALDLRAVELASATDGARRTGHVRSLRTNGKA